MPEYISAISNERVALVHADTTRFDALAESFSAQLAASGSNTEQAPARDPHPLHPLGAGARIVYDLNALQPVKHRVCSIFARLSWNCTGRILPKQKEFWEY